MDRKSVFPHPSPSGPAAGGAGGGSGNGVGGGQIGMSGGAGTGLLFLREEQMRLAQDLFFFAYRDLTACADPILEEHGLGRAHHRALHFIGRRPGIAVSELLAVLRITKQSLARVLGELIERALVVQRPGPTDRRQRLLSLTADGQALERRLFEQQRRKMVGAYREAGGVAVEGFRRVMREVMDPETRVTLERPDPGPARQGNG